MSCSPLISSTVSVSLASRAGLRNLTQATSAASRDRHARAPPVARLAVQLGIGADHVRGLLRAEGNAVLGPRRVARRFGATVQWNPRDDDCVACATVIARDSPGPACGLVAEIIEVAPSKEEA